MYFISLIMSILIASIAFCGVVNHAVNKMFAYFDILKIWLEPSKNNIFISVTVYALQLQCLCTYVFILQERQCD